MIVSIDSEFYSPTYHTITLQNKKGKDLKPITYINYNHVFFGCYDGKDYQVLDDPVKYFNSLAESTTVLTFFPYAEFQFLQNLLKQKHHLLPLKNSFIFQFKNRNNMNIKFIDLMKLTNFNSLEELVNTYLPKSTPDMDFWHEMKGKRAKIQELSENEIIHYNKLDCEYQYLAYKKFLDHIQYTLGVNASKFITFGQIVTEYFSKFDERGVLGQEKKDRSNNKNLELYDDLKHTYMGGGLIHNLAPLYSKKLYFDPLIIIDFISLYPTSLMFATDYFPASMDEVKMVYNNDDDPILGKKNIKYELSDFKDLYYIALIDFEYDDDAIPLTAVKVYQEGSLDSKEQITIFPKRGRRWCHKHELEQLQRMGMRVTKIYKVYYWIPSPYHKLKNELNRLIIDRLKYKKENVAVANLYKLLLNSLYGKMAQHEVEKGKKTYLNQIRNILIASMITGISRYIMLKSIDLLWQHDIKVYHMATDSLFVDDFKHSYMQQLYTELNNHGISFTKEFFNEEIRGRGYIFKNKVYYVTDLQKHKFAHHAIHLPKSSDEKMKFFNWLIQNYQTLQFGNAKIFQRDGYLKVDEWLNLQTHTYQDIYFLFSKPIIESYTFRYIHDDKLKVYEIDSSAKFKTMREYESLPSKADFWQNIEEYIGYRKKINRFKAHITNNQ